MIYWHHAAKYRHTEEYTDGGKEIISPSGVAEAAPWDGACCFGRKYTGPSDPLAREMDDFLWGSTDSRAYEPVLLSGAYPGGGTGDGGGGIPAGHLWTSKKKA